MVQKIPKLVNLVCERPLMSEARHPLLNDKLQTANFEFHVVNLWSNYEKFCSFFYMNLKLKQVVFKYSWT